METQTIESFIEKAKAFLPQLSSFETVRVIMGNQTCDLDSAICTLIQGFFEYCDNNHESIAVVPVFNIPQKEFRLKTEVTYYLTYHCLPLDSLIFRDQIDLQDLHDNKKLQLILVDHHTLDGKDVALRSSVVKIIDHRPLDPTWSWPEAILNVKTVGSCATLIASNILAKCPKLMNTRLSDLLQGPILVDTCNLLEKSGMRTDTDVSIVDALEQFGPFNMTRNQIFKNLMKAKLNISTLTVEEILFKDLKIINDVPIAVFPLLVKNFLEMENAIEAIEKFSFDRNCTVVILMGLYVDNSDEAHRDIAIFSTLSSQTIANNIIKALLSSTDPPLDAKFIKEIREENYCLSLYEIGNPAIRRKTVVPIIRKAILPQDRMKNVTER